MTILGQMNITRGFCVSDSESLVYVSQEPWVFSETVQNNILFGEIMDYIWYDRIVRACCLEAVCVYIE